MSYELMLLLKEMLGLGITGNNLSKEHLSSITSLRLQGIESLEGIEYLTGLKELEICSLEYSKLDSYVDITFHPYINKIKDFSLLFILDKLESLTITNDLFLEYLDISNLKNLKNLTIINNPKLKEIKGLDKLEKLENVIISGNHIQTGIDLKRYLKNTKMVNKNIIDIDFYLQAVKNDNLIPQFISHAFLKGETNILFSEPSGILEYTTTHPIQLEEMYKKIFSYLKREKVFDMSYSDKINFVYQYIIRNIKFNYKELMERNERYQTMDTKNVEFLKTNLTFLHNGYTTYHMKSGNCEGRVNLMHFILTMLDVSSQNVHCIDRRSRSMTPNHAILRIDNELQYIDPSYHQITTNNFYHFYMKNSDELESTHILNIFEKILEEEKNEKRDQDEKHFKKIVRRKRNRKF